MESNSRQVRRMFLTFAVVSIVACAGLGVLMNMTFGPVSQAAYYNGGTGVQNTSQPTATQETVAPGNPLDALGRVDVDKMPPPGNCGKGDRYAAVCKDGSVHKGFSSFACSNNGGLDYFLLCP